jgi:hypothetical protein
MLQGGHVEKLESSARAVDSSARAAVHAAIHRLERCLHRIAECAVLPQFKVGNVYEQR